MSLYKKARKTDRKENEKDSDYCIAGIEWRGSAPGPGQAILT